MLRLQVRTPARILAVLAAAVVLSGCFEYRTEVAINEDGSGSVVLEADLDPTLLTSLPPGMEMDNGTQNPPEKVDLEAACKAVFTPDPEYPPLPPGLTTEQIVTPDRCASVLRTTWAAGESFEKKIAAFNEVFAITSGETRSTPTEPVLQLEQTPDGGWSVRFLVSTDGTIGDEGLCEFGQAVFADKSLRFALTLPGTVVEHNGTLEGSTVRWEVPMLDILAGRMEPFTARSVPSPVDTPSRPHQVRVHRKIRRPPWAAAAGMRADSLGCCSRCLSGSC